MSVDLNYTTMNAPAGSNFIINSVFRFRRIIQVSREGSVFDIIRVGPFFVPPAGSRQVNYYAPLGTFTFPTDTTFNPGETITVKWR